MSDFVHTFLRYQTDAFSWVNVACLAEIIGEGCGGNVLTRQVLRGCGWGDVHRN